MVLHSPDSMQTRAPCSNCPNTWVQLTLVDESEDRRWGVSIGMFVFREHFKPMLDYSFTRTEGVETWCETKRNNGLIHVDTSTIACAST